MFLTAAELITLTGRKTARAQIRVLQQNGIVYHLTADHKPVVYSANLSKPEQPTIPERPKLNLPKIKPCGNGKPTNISHAASI